MDGVGTTSELCLRVSVATLVRVVFTAEHHNPVLVLERKATFHEREQRAIVQAQPFGGAVRIHDRTILEKITGGFHFDSEHSHAKQDFRILIRPSAWGKVKDFCLEQFQAEKEAVFETSPARELTREFQDSLDIHVNPDQYVFNPLYTVVENDASPTTNIHAEGQPTARVYRVFEAQIVDRTLCELIQRNSDNFSDQDLRNRALKDRRHGSQGRANACLVLPMDTLRQSFLSVDKNSVISWNGTVLEKNVGALFDDVTIPHFQYIRP